MPENTRPDWVGVDIAAERLDYCVEESNEGNCLNNPSGYTELIAKLRRLPHPRVICEASGGYEKGLLAALFAAGIEVCLVSPGRVRSFAHAEGLLAKTDKLDARLLRRYAQSVQLRLSEPVDPALSVLRELLEHRRALTTQLSEVEARLPLAGATLAKLLGRQRSFLNKEIERVDKMIREHIDNDPDLRDKSARLQQIKGVGPVLSATSLAYLPELGKIDSAKLSALIGVAPHPKDSGKYKAPRHVRGGRSQVRHVLYMAAVCGIKHNPTLAAFYQRLRANGKPPMVCLIAVMRKMICLMNRLIQDPTFALAN
jgi:transposase